MKPTGLFILDEKAYSDIYSSEQRATIDSLVEIIAPRQSSDEIRDHPERLSEVQLLFSGWGGPRLDREFLAAAPDLQIVFYGAGSIRQTMTEAAWERRIRVTSAYAVNAIPVAEFTVSQIVYCLKLGWQHVLATKQQQRWAHLPQIPGAFGSTVGIVALGQIGQRVCRMLQDYDVRVLAYDPFASGELARHLNVTLVSLETIFRESDVVSIHAPSLPETHHMIRGAHVGSMKQFASLINTARGALIDEPEMIEVLGGRPDLVAVLDVAAVEPPDEDSPLWDLPNVMLTPHIAGSVGRECQRMGQCMVDELKRYLAGQPLEREITRENAARLA